MRPGFDSPAESAQSGELYWLDGSSSGHSWKQGDPSNTPGTAVSSFEVMDHLLSMVTDRARFPNLRVITLIGHSAGGQYVQRYAAGTQAPASFAEHRFVFVVANPSSYLYLNGQRPRAWEHDRVCRAQHELRLRPL